MRLEILETITDPAQMFAGNRGELFAVRDIEWGQPQPALPSPLGQVQP